MFNLVIFAPLIFRVKCMLIQNDEVLMECTKQAQSVARKESAVQCASLLRSYIISKESLRAKNVKRESVSPDGSFEFAGTILNDARSSGTTSGHHEIAEFITDIQNFAEYDIISSPQLMLFSVSSTLVNIPMTMNLTPETTYKLLAVIGELEDQSLHPIFFTERSMRMRTAEYRRSPAKRSELLPRLLIYENAKNDRQATKNTKKASNFHAHAIKQAISIFANLLPMNLCVPSGVSDKTALTLLEHIKSGQLADCEIDTTNGTELSHLFPHSTSFKNALVTVSAILEHILSIYGVQLNSENQLNIPDDTINLSSYMAHEVSHDCRAEVLFVNVSGDRFFPLKADSEVRIGKVAFRIRAVACHANSLESDSSAKVLIMTDPCISYSSTSMRPLLIVYKRHPS